MSESFVLDLPPLPPLEFSNQAGDVAWSGSIFLPLWDEFYLYLESHYDSPGYVNDEYVGYPLRINMRVMSEVEVDPKRAYPTTEQVAAYTYLIENQKIVQDAVLQAMFDNYPRWQEEYSVYPPEYMPAVNAPEDFKALVVLVDVDISFEAREGVAYVMSYMTPLWDMEHGMGVVLHKDRVVAIGDYELVWNAGEQDMTAWQNEQKDASS